jgi:hypothetical protein
MIGEGSVGEEFSTLFVLFINNKLDKLMTPQDILFNTNEAHVINTLKASIGSGQTYRADIGSTIATRVVNYAIYHAETNAVDKNLIERIAKLISSDIFTNDLKYNVVKGIFNGNQVKFRNLTLHKDLTKYILA